MKGIGTDIIEIKRIKQLNHRERFIHKLLSEEEFSKYRTNINIPSLGKLYCTYDRFLRVKKRFKII